MIRRLLFSSLLPGILVPPVAAQDGPPADRIYIATYNIAYSDIPAWMEAHNSTAVPILDAMVEEGVLNNHNIWMHHTGGEYTMRQAYIGHADTDYEAFWEDYLGRLRAADPAGFAATNAMIRAHEDEIFDMAVVNVTPGDAQPRYLYEAKFQIPFGDLEEWGALWEEHFVPVAEQMLAEGRVRGFVIQEHNTGSKYNRKFSWLFDEWDNFDEVEAAFFSAVPLDHEVFGMFYAHRDELWQAPPSN
ncbi:MAG: hypothetical protein HKO53_14865 [Gemmatimonadetes bacterium]|nr:hypothetical protein [Gemmatimonadota bacterium]NNM34356.1 hypothetical protein [Gemmatimonadota bacterium]